MNYTKGEWKANYTGSKLVSVETTTGVVAICGKPQWILDRDIQIANANIIASAPDMYEALKEADNLIKLARRFFPKSIHNPDKFQLENTCAMIGKAIAKAEGK